LRAKSAGGNRFQIERGMGAAVFALYSEVEKQLSMVLLVQLTHLIYMIPLLLFSNV
jgi:hypothetical protein